jgi:nicotinic acid mononucleotide adenylyltransferase
LYQWNQQQQIICRTTLEEKINLRVGTADLLDMLLEQDHSLEITLALGADTFMDLTRWKWKRSKDIIQMIEGRMIVFRRIFHGDELEKVNIHHDTATTATVTATVSDAGNNSFISDDEILERIHVVSDILKETCPKVEDHIMMVKLRCLSSVSSSVIRRCNCEKDLSLLREELDERVLEYIKKNKLYGFSEQD